MTSAQCANAAEFNRIISLYPGHTDNIAALGCRDKLIAVSVNDDRERFAGLPRLPMKVGAERILALRPDLVIIRGLVEKQNPTLKNILKTAGVKVVSLDPPIWDDFGAYIKELSALCGADPKAAQDKLTGIIEEISKASDRIFNDKQRPRVFVEATARELHTCAPDSWAAHLISLAGGVNAASSAKPLRKGSALAVWGLERVLESVSYGIDVYIVQQGAMNGTTEEDLNRRPWFRAFNGVRAAVIPEAYLSRPSLIGIEHGGKLLLEIFAEN